MEQVLATYLGSEVKDGRSFIIYVYDIEYTPSGAILELRVVLEVLCVTWSR